MTCDETLVVHKDGTCACVGIGCLAGSLVDVVLRHRLLVSCQAVFDKRCPMCNPAMPAEELDEAGTGGSSSLCSGTAILHMDGTTECSEPGCLKNLSTRTWLAGHLSVQPCRFLPNACSRCSTDVCRR